MLLCYVFVATESVLKLHSVDVQKKVMPPSTAVQSKWHDICIWTEQKMDQNATNLVFSYDDLSCNFSELNLSFMNNSSDLSLCRLLPLIPGLTQQPSRSLTYFSLKKGKRKTVKSVTDRFMRLHCDLWIRRKVCVINCELPNPFLSPDKCFLFIYFHNSKVYKMPWVDKDR